MPKEEKDERQPEDVLDPKDLKQREELEKLFEDKVPEKKDDEEKPGSRDPKPTGSSKKKDETPGQPKEKKGSGGGRKDRKDNRPRKFFVVGRGTQLNSGVRGINQFSDIGDSEVADKLKRSRLNKQFKTYEHVDFPESPKMSGNAAIKNGAIQQNMNKINNPQGLFTEASTTLIDDIIDSIVVKVSNAINMPVYRGSYTNAAGRPAYRGDQNEDTPVPNLSLKPFTLMEVSFKTEDGKTTMSLTGLRDTQYPDEVKDLVGNLPKAIADAGGIVNKNLIRKVITDIVNAATEEFENKASYDVPSILLVPGAADLIMHMATLMIDCSNIICLSLDVVHDDLVELVQFDKNYGTIADMVNDLWISKYAEILQFKADAKKIETRQDIIQSDYLIRYYREALIQAKGLNLYADARGYGVFSDDMRKRIRPVGVTKSDQWVCNEFTDVYLTLNNAFGSSTTIYENDGSVAEQNGPGGDFAKANKWYFQSMTNHTNYKTKRYITHPIFDGILNWLNSKRNSCPYANQPSYTITAGFGKDISKFAWLVCASMGEIAAQYNLLFSDMIKLLTSSAMDSFKLMSNYIVPVTVKDTTKGYDLLTWDKLHDWRYDTRDGVLPRLIGYEEMFYYAEDSSNPKLVYRPNMFNSTTFGSSGTEFRANFNVKTYADSTEDSVIFWLNETNPILYFSYPFKALDVSKGKITPVVSMTKDTLTVSEVLNALRFHDKFKYLPNYLVIPPCENRWMKSVNLENGSVMTKNLLSTETIICSKITMSGGWVSPNYAMSLVSTADVAGQLSCVEMSIPVNASERNVNGYSNEYRLNWRVATGFLQFIKEQPCSAQGYLSKEGLGLYVNANSKSIDFLDTTFDLNLYGSANEDGDSNLGVMIQSPIFRLYFRSTSSGNPNFAFNGSDLGVIYSPISSIFYKNASSLIEDGYLNEYMYTGDKYDRNPYMIVSLENAYERYADILNSDMELYAYIPWNSDRLAAENSKRSDEKK